MDHSSRDRRVRPSLHGVGVRYGRVIVVGDVGKRTSSGGIHWLCRCDCGKETYRTLAELARHPDTSSCGCWGADRMKYTPPGRTHGLSRTPTYSSWLVMRRRCLDTGFKDYPLYGGRGISIDHRWDDYSVFLSDMGEKPEGYTIDRVDVDGNYCLANCRWASRLTQGNNTRRNHRITYCGKTQTMAEWARELGMSYTLIRARLNVLKWSVSKTFEAKVDIHGYASKDYDSRENSTAGVRVRPGVLSTTRIYRQRVCKP